MSPGYVYGATRTKPASHLRLVQAPPMQVLTPRQVEVLQMSADGMSARAIASHFGVSNQAVWRTTARARSALGARNQADAVRIALLHGFIEPPIGPAPTPPSPTMTRLLRLVAAGKDNRQITRALNSTDTTTATRLKRQYEAWGVRTRAQLTAIAVHHGFLS